MDIRTATAADARAIAEIRVLGWQTAYRGIVADADLDAMSVEHDIPRWTALLGEQSSPRRTLVVVDDDDRAVGFGTMGPYRHVEDGPESAVTGEALPGTTGELYAFYVHPSHWGTGCAAPLMDACLDRLRSDGWPVALLWVLAENARARRFYARHGWQPDGTTQVLAMAGNPAEVRLARDLSG